MAQTPFLGLHVYGGDVSGSITDNGSQHTYADRLTIDQVIAQLVTSGRHYVPPSSSASALPVLQLNTTGGLLADGQQLCYRIGLVGLDGFERMAGNEVSIFTPPILLAPDVPGLRDGTGTLVPGLYYYALSAKGDVQESILSGSATVNVFYGLNQGVYVDAPDDDQNVALQVWRKKDSDPGFTRLGVIQPGESYLDDGSIPAERYARDPSYAAPTSNRGVATNAITVQLTGAAAAAALAGTIKAWRIYRTTISGFYSGQSLVHEVVERDGEDDDSSTSVPTLKTAWVDTGDNLLSGTPQNKDRALTLTPYAPETVTALPTDTAGYPENYPLVYQGQLYLLVNGAWQAGTGGSGTVVTYGPVLPAPAGRANGDLHLVVSDGSWYAIVTGAWSLVYKPRAGGGSPIMTSPDGNRWRTIVADDGTLSTLATLEPGPPAAPTNPVLED